MTDMWPHCYACGRRHFGSACPRLPAQGALIAWHNPQSYLPDCFEMLDGHWAMPQAARAADASHSSLLRVSTIGGIAIAALTALYFGGQLLRAVVS